VYCIEHAITILREWISSAVAAQQCLSSFCRGSDPRGGDLDSRAWPKPAGPAQFLSIDPFERSLRPMFISAVTHGHRVIGMGAQYAYPPSACKKFFPSHLQSAPSVPPGTWHRRIPGSYRSRQRSCQAVVFLIRCLNFIEIANLHAEHRISPAVIGRLLDSSRYPAVRFLRMACAVCP